MTASLEESSSSNAEVHVEYDALGFVVNYVCPHCRAQVQLDHVDDIGTSWFKCSKCGQQSAKLKSPQRVALEREVAFLRDAEKPVTLSEVSRILDSTIKADSRNKVITFLTMLLTFTEEDQINVSFTAESSTGKSYIPLELAWYFPKESIIEYSYVSPTAFFHEYGTLRPDPTDQRDVDENKKRKIIVINLYQKILIFIDQPHDLLLQRLRPLLSHDRKTLVSKITDRREKAGLRTKTVVIEGYPTVLFCTAKFSMQDQERTRLLLLSPDTTQEKLKDAILLRIERESNRAAFREYMEQDYGRNWLQTRVHAIANAHIKNLIIPEDLRRRVADQFFTRHNALIPRHQRDIGRLLALIKAHALLNLWHRERIDDAVLVTEQDVEEGFNLYGQVSKANELGLPPEIFNVYTTLQPKIPEAGVTQKEFQGLYYRTFGRTIGKKRLAETVGLLESVGLLSEEPDPSDRRRKLLLPTCQGVFNSQAEDDGSEAQGAYGKINTPAGVGDTSLFASCGICHEAKSLDDMSKKLGKPTCKRCAGEDLS